MRLFIAADIEAPVAAAVGALIEDLRGRAARLAPLAKVTWVAADRLHLTIRFIGDVAEDQAHVIRSVLGPPVNVRPFRLTIEGLGAFPKSGQPRVLWAGLTTGREALLELEREITQRLSAVPVTPEPRAYNPHLTLARVREASGLRSASLFGGLADRHIGTTAIEAITLFESRLSSTGPTYVPLLRTSLWPTEPA